MRVCVREMSSFETWLQPLRAYPSGFVFACFALVAAVVLWGLAKVMKWSVYIFAVIAFAAVAGGFAWWLWA